MNEQPTSACADDAYNSIFFGAIQVRLVMIGGAPWFHLLDILEILGLPVGPKTPASSRIPFLKSGVDQDVLDFVVGGIKEECVIISLKGAKALCGKRDRKRDKSVKAFLSYHERQLVPPKPKKEVDRAEGPLPLNGQRVRFVVVDDLPWWHASDFIGALGLDADETVRNRVADVHCLTAPLTVAGGDTEDALFLSPIGAWQLCLDRDDPRPAMWVFAETKAIRPHAFEQSIHGAVQMMALLPDGDLPPRPHTRSGRVDEWSALKASSEHANYVAARHSITRQLAHNQMRADAEQSNFKD